MQRHGQRPTCPKCKGSVLGRNENVRLVGQTGIAQALGHRACLRGFNVLYTSAHAMFQQLRAARADASYERKPLRYTAPDLLIIDDLGLRPLTGEEPLDLYEIIRCRYERGSMIITSNRDLEEWPPLFNDALLAGAAMDRLLHHRQVIEIEGESFRNPKTRGKRAA